MGAAHLVPGQPAVPGRGGRALADGLLLLNEVDRTFALDRGWQPPERVSVVPHGISGRFSEAPPSKAPRGAGLLFCGTWDYVKGMTYLCDAMSRLHAGGTPARLTVLGPGVRPEAVLDSFDPAVRPFVTVIERVPRTGHGGVPPPRCAPLDVQL